MHFIHVSLETRSSVPALFVPFNFNVFFSMLHPPPYICQYDNNRSIAAAWKGLQERNVVLQDTEEGYAAQLGDSVR